MRVPRSERDGWEPGLVVAQIEIRRTLVSVGSGETAIDGDLVEVHHRDEQGEPLAMIDVLGLLEFAKDTAVRQFMGED